MKRLLALFLVLAMVFSFAACEKDEDTRPARSDRDDDDDDDRKDHTTEPVTSEEFVLLEDDDYVVKIKRASSSSWDLSFENLSSSDTYRFGSNGCTFNGLSINGYIGSSSVEPGETETDYIYPSYDTQQILGTITDIALHVEISDNDYNTLVSEVVHCYPMGEDAATTYERPPEDTDLSLVDDPSFGAVLTGYSVNKDYFTASLFYVNRSNKTLDVGFSNTTVNRFSFNPSCSFRYLLPNACGYARLTWSTKSLQDAGIRKIEEVLTTLTVTDAQDSNVTVLTQELDLKPENMFVAKAEPQEGAIAIETITALEQEGAFLAQVTGLSIDSNGKPTVQLYFENKSENASYTFYMDSAYINGLNTSIYQSLTLEPGQKTIKNISLSWSSEELGQCTDIQLEFSVRLSDKYDDLAVNTIHIYPQGEEKATVYNHPIKVTDHVLLDNEYITMVITEVSDNYDGGIGFSIYYKNKTDELMVIDWEGCSVNGISKDNYHGMTLLPGTCGYTSASWYGDFMAENNITTVEKILVRLELKNSNSYSASPYFTQALELLEEPYELPQQETEQ